MGDYVNLGGGLYSGDCQERSTPRRPVTSCLCARMHRIRQMHRPRQHDICTSMKPGTNRQQHINDTGYLHTETDA